jgi:hypothetical protein
MKFTKLSLITVALIATTSSYAMEYKTLGVQATSMGGASVASSSGSMSVFNNPAMLAKSTHDVEISLNAGIGLTDNKLGASISELDKSNFTTTLQNYDPATATAEQLATLVAGKNIILGMNGNSINVSPEASLGFQVKHIGFGVFGYGDINAKSVVDQAHNQLIIEDPNNKGTYINIETNTESNLIAYQNSSMEYAINNNLTYLNIQGLAVSEVPVGYGQTFNTGYGSLSLGSSLKYMYGITYSENIFVDNKNITENLSTHKVASSTFGIDTGLLYEPSFLS